MRITFLALSALALAAGTQASANHIEVRYDDLNLASVSGQKTFERRIEKAAREVCEVDVQRTGTRIVPADVKNCHAAARASARQQRAILVERETAQKGG